MTPRRSGPENPIRDPAAATPAPAESSALTPKAIYQQFRQRTIEQLWTEDIPRFNQASARERMTQVPVIRALGVVGSDQASPELKQTLRQWLRSQLSDPNEKIRRYAATALPKLDAGPEDEEALVALLKTSTLPREKEAIEEALALIGGVTTLRALQSKSVTPPVQVMQRVKAAVARSTQPSAVQLDRVFELPAGMTLHLRCRSGLEGILKGEADEFARRTRSGFCGDVQVGMVEFRPKRRITLGEIFEIRCFATLGIVLAKTGPLLTAHAQADGIARVMASPQCQSLLRSLTLGSMRYRIEMHGDGRRNATIQQVAERIYTACPDLLNDPNQAPWTLHVHPSISGITLELSPKVLPDPRWRYRLDDVAAASHPPLAAALARVSGRFEGERVWDPFCGSGMELIERSLLGDVVDVFGSDIDPRAIAIAEANFNAAGLRGIQSHFGAADFRDVPKLARLTPGSISLVLTNPPMGRRVQVESLRGLIRDLFEVSASVLMPGGRLIFPNPLRLQNPHPELRLQYRQKVDMGGFDCLIEKYVRISPQDAPDTRPTSRPPEV